MGGDNLLKVLITTMKAKITPLVTKFKVWTSWNFIRTRLISSIRDFFGRLLDVKPRHKKDYYEVFGWLVSRRLAMALVVSVGVVSLYYLLTIRGVLTSAWAEGIKTYSYDSVLLRFADEKVRITAKDGYVAYEGEVSDGGVNGYGILYDKDGGEVYKGNFVKNLYHGNGTRYYPNGNVHYSGNFDTNEFDGEGKLYRENGSLAYSGDFSFGLKDGEGSLYDSGSNLIYTGGFSQDELVYSDFLGKNASEIANVYSGKRTLYENEEEFAVVLEDIDAMYLGSVDGETLDAEVMVDRVVILKDTFRNGGKECKNVSELRDYFFGLDYEGNAEVTMAEAVALNLMADRGGIPGEKVEMDVTSEYSDYKIVEDFDRTFVIYLYSFHKDGVVYTFVCRDRDEAFSFYFIEKEEGGGAA